VAGGLEFRASRYFVPRLVLVLGGVLSLIHTAATQLLTDPSVISPYLQELPGFSEPMSTSGEQDKTCPISEACCEGMCTDMFCKLKRDGKSCGTVIVHSVCVCVRARPSSDLPSQTVSSGGQKLSALDSLPHLAHAWLLVQAQETLLMD